MNYTTRITDWTCDRSDRHRAARRDVRFYHVGVPQIKKSLFLLLLLLFFRVTPHPLRVLCSTPISSKK